jgi:hypothetical protein
LPGAGGFARKLLKISLLPLFFGPRTSKVLSATSKVFLATSKVIVATLKVLPATLKVFVATMGIKASTSSVLVATLKVLAATSPDTVKPSGVKAATGSADGATRRVREIPVRAKGRAARDKTSPAIVRRTRLREAAAWSIANRGTPDF